MQGSAACSAASAGSVGGAEDVLYHPTPSRAAFPQSGRACKLFAMMKSNICILIPKLGIILVGWGVSGAGSRRAFLRCCQGPGSRLGKALNVQKLLKSLVLRGISVILPGFSRRPASCPCVGGQRASLADAWEREDTKVSVSSRGWQNAPVASRGAPGSRSLPLCPLVPAQQR